MKLPTWMAALWPGGRRQARPVTLNDIEREHFALRTAVTYTVIAAGASFVGGWMLVLVSAVAPWLWTPAILALVISGLLVWKSIRIGRRLRTLDDFIR